MGLFLNGKPRQAVEPTGFLSGGHARNRTGVRGFAVRCVTTPPRGHLEAAHYWIDLHPLSISANTCVVALEEEYY